MSSRRRIGLVLGFYLAMMAILAGAFFLTRQQPPPTGTLPSVIPTIDPSSIPTPFSTPMPTFGPPHTVAERAPLRVSGECTVTIPRPVTKVNGNGRYGFLGPGDIICLQAGTRPNIKFFNLHGQAGNPIIIRNDGGVVRITGQTNKQGGISLLRTSSIRVTGTGVSDACGARHAPDEQECGIVIADAFNGVRVAPDGRPRRIELDHIQVAGTSDQNHSTGFSIHPAKNQTISGFYVHDNYLVDIFREGMYIGSEPHGEYSTDLGQLADIDVSFNLVQRTGYDGIKVKVAIDNVRVHDNIVISPALDKFPKHDTGIQLATTNAWVYNNVVRGGMDGIANGRPFPGAETRYFNNVVIGPSREGFVTSEDGAWIYNNTVLNTGSFGIEAKGNDSQVFDNIVAGAADLPVKGGPGLVATNNLIGSATEMGFMSPARGDVRPRSTSPAVDRGASTGVYPPWDVRRIERPQGTRPDIGAYEYKAP